MLVFGCILACSEVSPGQKPRQSRSYSEGIILLASNVGAITVYFASEHWLGTWECWAVSWSSLS